MELKSGNPQQKLPNYWWQLTKLVVLWKSKNSLVKITNKLANFVASQFSKSVNIMENFFVYVKNKNSTAGLTLETKI